MKSFPGSIQQQGLKTHSFPLINLFGECIHGKLEIKMEKQMKSLVLRLRVEADLGRVSTY